MTKIEIFLKFVEILMNEAPSEKARSFVSKLASASAGREQKLVDFMALDERVISDNYFFPIEDNRLFWMAKWQEALNA